MVIWATGISGAGKTTLCDAIWRILKPKMPQLVSLDGDALRDLFGNDLSYKEPDRVRQIHRIQGMAKFLADQGQTVLVGALYAHPDLLKWNRENLVNYFEVYIDAPLSVVKARDPKGLYAKVDEGNMKDVVGIDIPWHAPKNPDLVFNPSDGLSPEEMAQKVIDTAIR